jgi:hypothetical protein
MRCLVLLLCATFFLSDASAEPKGLELHPDSPAQFLAGLPRSIAVSVSVGAACSVSTAFVRRVVDEVLVDSGVEPLDWPQLPDWYGMDVQFECADERRMLVDVAHVDDVDGTLERFGEVYSLKADFNEPQWKRLCRTRTFGTYDSTARALVIIAVMQFLEFNTQYLSYYCERPKPAGGGCGLHGPIENPLVSSFAPERWGNAR